MDIGGGPPDPACWNRRGRWTSRWPPADIGPTAFYLGPDGTLTNSAAATDGEDEYTPTCRPATRRHCHRVTRAAEPPYQWQPVAGDHGLGYVTDPLAEDLVIVGPASLDLFLKSSGPTPTSRSRSRKFGPTVTRATCSSVYCARRTGHRRRTRPASKSSRRTSRPTAKTCLRTSSRWCAFRSSPWRTRSVAVRDSASRSRHPVANVRRGSSIPRKTVRRRTRSRVRPGSRRG